MARVKPLAAANLADKRNQHSKPFCKERGLPGVRLIVPDVSRASL
jgi:hypothetical protein